MRKIQKNDIIKNVWYAKAGCNQEILANLPEEEGVEPIFGGKYLIDNGKAGFGLFPIAATSIKEAFDKFDSSFKVFADKLDEIYKEELKKQEQENTQKTEEKTELDSSVKNEDLKKNEESGKVSAPAGTIIEFPATPPQES